jgi:hypothetical protein
MRLGNGTHFYLPDLKKMQNVHLALNTKVLEGAAL